MKKHLILFLSLLSLGFVTISCSKDDENKDEEFIGYPGPNTLALYVSFQDEDGNDLLRERVDPLVASSPNKGLDYDYNWGKGEIEANYFLGKDLIFTAGVCYSYASLPLPERLQGWGLEKNIDDIGHDVFMLSLFDILWYKYMVKEGKDFSLEKDYHFTITYKCKALFGDDDIHTFDIGYHFIDRDREYRRWIDYDYDITFDNKKCEVDAHKSIPGSPYYLVNDNSGRWGSWGKREVTIILPKDK